MTLPDRLLRVEDLAALLGKSAAAVRVQRHRNPELLPPAVRIGCRVFFDPRDVEVWIETNKEHRPDPRRGDSDPKAGATVRQIRLAAVTKRSADRR